MAQGGATGAQCSREGERRRRPGRGAGALRPALAALLLLAPCAALGLLASALPLLPPAPCWGLCLLLLLRR